jgi:DNA-nicking Smr family endonuclease
MKRRYQKSLGPLLYWKLSPDTAMVNAPLVPNDDEKLFRKAMANVRPLRQSDRVVMGPKRKPPKPRSRWHPADTEPLVKSSVARRVTSTELLEFRRSGVSNRIFRQLRGGRSEIEAEIDLHGLTTSTARQALKRFIDGCLQRRLRYVRIIHGRGLGSGSQGPVLKTEVNHLLRHWEPVLAFTSAPAWDGGSGAVYVLLRRR